MIFPSMTVVKILIVQMVSQISGLEKLLSASLIAPLELVEVPCETDTMTMTIKAIKAITPMGITLRMMATMVVRKIATRSQAWGVSPGGV